MNVEKKKRAPLASMALAGFCGVLWLYIAMFRWPEEERPLALIVAGMWLVVCVTWGLRVWKAHKARRRI